MGVLVPDMVVVVVVVLGVVVVVVVLAVVGVVSVRHMLDCCVPGQPPVGVFAPPGGGPSRPGDMFFQAAAVFCDGVAFTSLMGVLGVDAFIPGSREAAGLGTGPSSPS